MPLLVLLADLTNSLAPEATGPVAGNGPGFLGRFGLMLLPLLALGGFMITVLVERALLYHREQINAAEFLAGVRNVLKRENVVEALAICDATPGPVARLVKAAIVARDGGRSRVQEVIDEVGLIEVPRLESRLNVLATVAQIGPYVGLFGTLLGFVGVFNDLQSQGSFSAPAQLFQHLWQSLYTALGGLGIAIVSYTGYNLLVGRVNQIVLDMEKASAEILRLLSDGKGS